MKKLKEMEYLGDKNGYLSKYYIGSGVRHGGFVKKSQTFVRHGGFYDKSQTFQSRKPLTREELKYVGLRCRVDDCEATQGSFMVTSDETILEESRKDNQGPVKSLKPMKR